MHLYSESIFLLKSKSNVQLTSQHNCYFVLSIPRKRKPSLTQSQSSPMEHMAICDVASCYLPGLLQPAHITDTLIFSLSLSYPPCQTSGILLGHFLLCTLDRLINCFLPFLQVLTKSLLS